jgi:peptidoglycan-N-acetylglucosamine deacetylase
MSLFSHQQIVRKVKTSEKNIYLTFDDGPTDLTNSVLDLLNQHQAKASFFVIGHQADQHPLIMSRLLYERHGLYTHSVDHDYKHYFGSQKATLNWMTESISHLERYCKHKKLIFRPPAGILTPPLLRAAQQSDIKLILWNYRFYDSIFSLTEKKIHSYLKKIQPGDIVLLHDRQKPNNSPLFLKSLDQLLHHIQVLGFTAQALPF